MAELPTPDCRRLVQLLEKHREHIDPRFVDRVEVLLHTLALVANGLEGEDRMSREGSPGCTVDMARHFSELSSSGLTPELEVLLLSYGMTFDPNHPDPELTVQFDRLSIANSSSLPELAGRFSKHIVKPFWEARPDSSVFIDAMDGDSRR